MKTYQIVGPISLMIKRGTEFKPVELRHIPPANPDFLCVDGFNVRLVGFYGQTVSAMADQQTIQGWEDAKLIKLIKDLP